MTQTVARRGRFADNEKSAKGKQDFDLVEYLESHGVEVGQVQGLWHSGTLWELARCPWQPEKSGGGPFVIQFANGGITAGCHHPPCENKGWNDLRDVIDPDWREAAEKKGTKKAPSVAQQSIALAADDELFHTPDQQAFASLSRNNHRETWRIKSKSYKLLLRGDSMRGASYANDSALDDAIATLEGKALFEGRSAPSMFAPPRLTANCISTCVTMRGKSWKSPTMAGM